jgi:superfamily I DNA/RNA helicase
MSYFSDLFKDKYNSPILREYIEKIVREMADLKIKNSYAMKEIERRNIEILRIEEALTELGIPCTIVKEEDFDEDYDE